MATAWSGRAHKALQGEGDQVSQMLHGRIEEEGVEGGDKALLEWGGFRAPEQYVTGKPVVKKSMRLMAEGSTALGLEANREV